MNRLPTPPEEIQVAAHVAGIIAKAFEQLLDRENRPWPFTSPGVMVRHGAGNYLSLHWPDGRTLDVHVTTRLDDRAWQEVREKSAKIAGQIEKGGKRGAKL